MCLGAVKLKFKYLLVIGFLTAANVLFSQNLVPNSSFEDTVHCPTSTNQVFNWSNPTQCFPDYFNSCSVADGNAVHVPNNIWGNQNAHSGVAYTAKSLNS